MNRHLQSDLELAQHFTVTIAEDGQTAIAACKEKDEEGAPCAASWELEVDEQGTITLGVRNSLLGHARAHAGGFRKMRRLS